ncbi:MAG: hypothetical protein RL199_306 [Pseudomonadota bacterium]|jgi:hypothetical protein
MSGTRFWHLFIDESGRFEDRGEDVCVGGWLIEAPNDASVDRVLRRQLARAFPSFAYPPQAKHVNIGAAHLVSFASLQPKVRRSHPDAERLEAAVDRTRFRPTPPSPGAARIHDALREGRWPTASTTVEDLRSYGSWLRRVDRALFDALEAEVREARARLASMTATIAREVAPGACALVLATETQRPAAEAPASPDRYLGLLETLLSRVVALLRARSGADHHVWVHVEGRHVESCFPRHPLMPSHVGQAARAALLAPGPAAGSTNIRFVPDSIARKDDAMPAGVAVADFITNRLRGQVTSQPSATTLERFAAAAFGLPARLQPAGLPDATPQLTLVADGAARKAFEAIWSPAGVPGVGAFAPGWIVADLASWSTAARPSVAGGVR